MANSGYNTEHTKRPFGMYMGEGSQELKLHLAERDPQHHAWPKRGVDRASLRLRILLSYWYYKDVDLDTLFAKYFSEPYPDVFADSGAYSAMTQGVKITPRAYSEWLKRYDHLFTAYANLDVIKNAEQTWKNQQILEEMGLQPIPAFHVLEDFSWLEQYVEQYPYIALGVAGMQGRGGLMAWLVKCFKIAEDKAVFHGFALTSWKVMRSFPWYSVDSSSWGQGFRYGQVPIFDTRRGSFVKLSLGDYDAWRKHGALVREMGFDPLDFADRERNDRAKICAISALSYMMAEQWLRRIHGEVRIPGNSGGPSGPKAHLVAGASSPDAPLGGNMSVTALAQAGFGGGGDHLHLSDTSNGINLGDAQKGLRLHLADARPQSGSDLASAQSGLRTYLTDSPHTPLRPAAAVDAGLKSYLGATAPGQRAEWRSRSTTQEGDLKIHLAEHSLDPRGG